MPIKRENRASHLENPLPAWRSFTPGQWVRFCPPEGAYSPRAAQSLVGWQLGRVIKVWGDYALVAFEQQRPLLCNFAYLEQAVYANPAGK